MLFSPIKYVWYVTKLHQICKVSGANPMLLTLATKLSDPPPYLVTPALAMLFPSRIHLSSSRNSLFSSTTAHSVWCILQNYGDACSDLTLSPWIHFQDAFWKKKYFLKFELWSFYLKAVKPLTRGTGTSTLCLQGSTEELWHCTKGIFPFCIEPLKLNLKVLSVVFVFFKM